MPQAGGLETDAFQRWHPGCTRRYGELTAIGPEYRQIIIRQALQPGILVRRKDGMGSPGLRQHLWTIENRMILE